MDSPLLELRGRLKGVKRNGNGFTALCPAHDDKQASLSVSLSDDSKVLLCCHAGCTPEAIVGAIGLKMKDLFPRDGSRQQSRIVETYDYRDNEARLLYQVVRLEPKSFRQRRPNGNGGWVWKLGDIERVPYLLPELVTAVKAGGRIFIAEGERDVEAIVDLGLAATCNAGGAGKWKDVFSEYLVGADVVIIPDNDKPGRSHGEFVARSLDGKASGLRVLELPDLCDKGDFSDWIATKRCEGLAKDDIRQELNKLAEQAPQWSPSSIKDTETASSSTEEILATLEQLPDTPDLSEVHRLLSLLQEALQGTDRLTRAIERERAHQALKGKLRAPSRLLDEALGSTEKRSDKPGQGEKIVLSDPEPSTEAVDGATLLSRLSHTFAEYVALPPNAADALALWVLHTYTLEAAFASPIMAVISPEKRCGKTTLLTLLFHLVRKPLPHQTFHQLLYSELSKASSRLFLSMKLTPSCETAMNSEVFSTQVTRASQRLCFGL